MSAINLTIAPTTKLTVLGVTATNVVLTNEEGATQSFVIADNEALASAKPGDVVSLARTPEGLENDYTIIAIESVQKTSEATTRGASRGSKGEPTADMRNPM